MLAKKCDRCGRLYEHYEGSERFKGNREANGLTLVDRYSDSFQRSSDTFDLCPKCMQELLNWLKGEKK